MTRAGNIIAARAAGCTLLVLSVSACGTLSDRSGFFTPADSAPQNYNIDIASIADAKPRVEQPSAYGNPDYYTVGARRYYPLKSSKGYVERGTASWYGTKFHGRRTSSGEPYDMFAMTAAHKTLPLPTYLQVTNLENNRQVIVRVNDRGPFHSDRLIDLSYAAAVKLDMLKTGTIPVEIRAIDPLEYQQRLAQKSPPTQETVSTAPPAMDRELNGHNSTTANAGLPPVPADKTDPAIYLQVAAFSDRQNAERLRQRLATVTTTGIQIQTAIMDDNYLYRVNLGPIPSDAEADRIVSQIITMGLGEPRRILN